MYKRDIKQLANRIALFQKKIARKSQPGHDPNDRPYDREIEKRIQKIHPKSHHLLLRQADD